VNSHALRDVVQGQPSLERLVEVCPDVPVSLVGGVVRDALLGRDPGRDLDLVVEGDAIEVARRLGRALGARVTAHERFGTAVVTLGDGVHLDLVTARREHYPSPGALPEVTAGTIDDDLARRDFTINAMAHRLTGPDAGVMLDPHGGRADLEAGVVRALRTDVFVEDPSRVLRAIRYAARLGFTLDEATAAAIRDAAPSLDPSNARVAEELRRMLGEPDAATALDLAEHVGIRWIVADGHRAATFAAIDDVLTLAGAPRLAPWALRLGLAVDPSVVRTVAVDGWARDIAGDVGSADELLAGLRAAGTRSEMDAVLRRSRPAAQVVAATRTPGAIGDWWANIRDMRPAIDGDDVLRAGVTPGPEVGRLLTRLRAGVLDGAVGADREAQLAWLEGEAR